MKQKAVKQDQEKRVRVPGLLEFLDEAESEASDAESPQFEEVGGEQAAPELLVGQAKLLLKKRKRMKTAT